MKRPNHLRSLLTVRIILLVYATLGDVALFSEEIIAYAHEENDYDMKQFRVSEGNPLAGMFYEKAFYDLKKECNVVLIGIVKMTEGKRKFMKNPEGSVKIEAGDYLVMLITNVD